MNKSNMKLISLRDQQLLQLNILKEIHNVCTENGIQYFLMYGSLLGAVRHKGFIPWDDDIDIGMTRQEYNKFLKVCEKGALDDRYLIQNYNTDKYFEFPISRICMKGTYSDDHTRTKLKSWKFTYVDIFPFDNAPNDENVRIKHYKKLRHFQRILRLKMNYQYKNISTLKKLLKGLISLPFKCIPLEVYKKKNFELITCYNTSETDYYCDFAGGRYSYPREYIKKQWLSEFILMKFENYEFWAPKAYKEILSHLFGDYMKLPPESERIIRHRVYVEEN